MFGTINTNIKPAPQTPNTTTVVPQVGITVPANQHSLELGIICTPAAPAKPVKSRGRLGAAILAFSAPLAPGDLATPPPIIPAKGVQNAVGAAHTANTNTPASASKMENMPISSPPTAPGSAVAAATSASSPALAGDAAARAQTQEKSDIGSGGARSGCSLMRAVASITGIPGGDVGGFSEPAHVLTLLEERRVREERERVAREAQEKKDRLEREKRQDEERERALELRKQEQAHAEERENARMQMGGLPPGQGHLQQAQQQFQQQHGHQM